MPKSEVFNQDCLAAMREMDDNAFDLAIVDPPYGIGNFIPQAGERMAGKFDSVTWNDFTPAAEYFNEVRRVSRNQIIWGANYYNCFGDEGGAIVWNKNQYNPKMSRCEIASHSFYKKVDYFEFTWNGLPTDHKAAIHPCQKPVALYKWLLQNYAKPGDTILDTHMGSQSSRIAAYDLGFDYCGYELDADYYKAGCERFDIHCSQGKLFAPVEELPTVEQSALFGETICQNS